MWHDFSLRLFYPTITMVHSACSGRCRHHLRDMLAENKSLRAELKYLQSEVDRRLGLDRRRELDRLRAVDRRREQFRRRELDRRHELDRALELIRRRELDRRLPSPRFGRSSSSSPRACRRSCSPQGSLSLAPSRPSPGASLPRSGRHRRRCKGPPLPLQGENEVIRKNPQIDETIR